MSFYHFWSYNCGFVLFFENFQGGGETNKVHGKTTFTQNKLSIQKLWQETCFLTKNGQLLFLPGTREKLFFPIYVVNFCETFCKCSFSSLGQDFTIKNGIFLIFFVWASWARNGNFEVFFEKKELHHLGVQPWICVFLIF
jgi:hypothetical protein